MGPLVKLKKACLKIEESLAILSETIDEMEKIERLKSIDIPLSEFKFTVRTRNALELREISTIRDLIRMSEREILRMRNLGRKSLYELNEFLLGRGLSFGMEVD